MNKSIYEEAKKSLASITFTMHYRVKPKMLGRCEDKNLNIIDKTLEQAEKQEKLLKMYQKFYYDYDDLTMNEVNDIIKEIKELEK